MKLFKLILEKIINSNLFLKLKDTETVKFIKEFIERIGKERPEFFKKLKAISLILFLIFAGITYTNYFLELLNFSYKLPENLVTIANELYQLFIIIFGFSFLPNKDMVKTDPPPTPIKP